MDPTPLPPAGRVLVLTTIWPVRGGGVLIPHQACVETPLLEVQITVYTSLDLPGLTGDQCLGQYHMGKYEGLFGVPLPAEYLQPLCSQYCSEPEPYLTGVCGIPDS